MTPLYLARGASTFGSSAATVAIFYSLYRNTANPAWISAYLALVGVATLISGPAAGWVSDRIGYRRVMITSDIMGGALFLLLAFVDQPILMVAVGVLASLVELPFFPASTAFVAKSLRNDPRQLQSAFGYMEAARNVGNLAGPVFAAVAIESLSQAACFAVNSSTFLVSATLIWRMRDVSSASPAARKPSLVVGLRFGWRTPSIRLVYLSWIPFAGAGAVAIVADTSLSTALEIGAAGFGLLLSLRAFGSILTGVFARRLPLTSSPMSTIVIGQAGVTLALAGIALSWAPTVTFLLALLHGVFDTVSFVGRQMVLQVNSPDNLRATIVGVFDSVAQTSSTVSFALASFIVTGLGPHGAYATAAGMTALAALTTLIARRAPYPPATTT